MRRILAVGLMAALVSGVPAAPALATPVCTDGYMGGPPRDLCGGRVFAEVENSVDYVQYLPNRQGFREYQHGLEYLEQLYPRYVEVFTFREHFGSDDAVSVGPDDKRSTDPADANDGYDILVAKLTDREVPDKGKQTLFFSLSVHGDEKGGIEGGVRALEDLAIAAANGGKIIDGVPGYDSTTGQEPVFHQYEVADVLEEEVIYFVDFNIDGFAAGEPSGGGALYTRGNALGTDLNRQMPTVGWINSSRNPLQESEMYYGHKLMHQVAAAGVNGKMAYGADVHGEGQSRAWVDIMYPAGEFSSVKHRQHMSIAERTKSVIDDTLYFGIPDAIEGETGGNAGEGIEDMGFPVNNTVPTKPARWGTVWDTLGYTDTGFLGDYMATELGVTGMDYEIAFNHSDTRAYGRPWGILLQENYVNATRAIVKTAMAYALFQEKEFAGFKIDPRGKVGYVFNPDVVTDSDANGPGTLPGPNEDGIGADGQEVVQKPYKATNMNFFADQSKHVRGGLTRIAAADVAAGSTTVNRFDTIVLADITAPRDSANRKYDAKKYFANLKAWVQRGGNLVLTDRGLHALEAMGVLAAGSVQDIKVYQPYSNIVAGRFSHPMVKGLRGNARQLSEATLVGYPIGNSASPMSIVTRTAWEAAGGLTVGTTGNSTGSSDPGAQTSVGELPLGKGRIRIMGGGLPMPTEENDHRFGLKDYSLTYSGLYIMENSIVHDAVGMGAPSPAPTGQSVPATVIFGIFWVPVALVAAVRRRLRR